MAVTAKFVNDGSRGKYNPSSDEDNSSSGISVDEARKILDALFYTPIAKTTASVIPVYKDLGKVAGGISDFWNGIGTGLGSVTGKVVDLIGGSNDSSAMTGVSAKPVVYSDWSPVSRLFGMSQDTAFSEHMANTAHQREVADLKAAGLNPVLGISGSGASVTSGSVASSGSSSALKADSSPLLDIMGATSALVTSLVTKNPMYGYMVANIFKSFD